MKKYYLAYGSNLNKSQMSYRCKNAKIIGSAFIKNYQLVYKGIYNECSYLTIKPSNGSYVPIGIYEISHIDELALDRYEGYPHLYHKKYVKININGKEEKALIYVMNKNFDYNLPSKHYIKICEIGYQDFNFDKKILDEALNITKQNIQNQNKTHTFFKNK